MTRNGKIARLPLALRTELNQRLQDGRPGVELVEWLNTLPEVQAILLKDFNGQAISEVNLSRWKTGGYVAWEQEQMVMERFGVMEETSADADPKAAAEPSIADRLSSFLVLQMAVELTRLDNVPYGPKKAAIHAAMVKNLWLLRRSDREAAKARLEEQQYRLGLYEEYENGRKRRKQEAQDNMTEEERQEKINRILGID